MLYNLNNIIQLLRYTAEFLRAIWNVLENAKCTLYLQKFLSLNSSAERFTEKKKTRFSSSCGERRRAGRRATSLVYNSTLLIRIIPRSLNACFRNAWFVLS